MLQQATSRSWDEGRKILVWRIGIAVAIFGSWELIGRFSDSTWISQPSLIMIRLTSRSSHLAIHLGTTVAEMSIGLVIGAPAGIMCGLWLGRSPILAGLLRPIIVALYSIPLITLAPLLILWFGLDMQPKIVLVAVVVFFLLFFNTYSGAKTMEKDLIEIFELMGANRRELFRKVIAPACTPWVLAGFRIALPYALIAATVGEMLMARRGLGFVITQAASQFDMAGVYAALIILMALGVLVAEATTWSEQWLLRWRSAAK